MVVNQTADSIELSNRSVLTVATNSFRAIRGRTVACAIFDELAYWRDSESATPDVETLRAVAPSMATIPNSLIIGVSSPYRKSGLLYSKFQRHWAKDGDDVLCIAAPSRQLNPTISQSLIDDAIAADPEAGRAEWLAECSKPVAIDPLLCTRPEIS